MSQLQAYLHFDGNCRQAMTFYQYCLGGELALQTVGETAAYGQSTVDGSERILHGSLTTDGFVLLASDLSVAGGMVKGNSISLMLNCDSETEINERFASLSAGGEVLHPLEPTFWGAIFGDLTDQYGIHWYLNFATSQAGEAAEV